MRQRFPRAALNCVVPPLHRLNRDRDAGASVGRLEQYAHSDVKEALAVSYNLATAAHRHRKADVAHADAIAEVHPGAPESRTRLEKERCAAQRVELSHEQQ